MMRIAFYAPTKSPDHPTPSGDREMARLLVKALGAAGHEVTVVSRLRTWSREASPDVRQDLETRAAEEARAVAASDWRPDLWVTYHPYYKAPDWIGPAVCRRLMIPYVTAEASYAGKRDHGPWREWQEAVVAGIRQAAVNFCLTAIDRDGLERVAGRQGVLVDLAPFVDPPPIRRRNRTGGGGPVELVTVAMMRPGDKLESYRMLAAVLGRLAHLRWRLTVVGDGPGRSEVQAAFSTLHDHISWSGALRADAVAERLAVGDVYVWPGYGEAYGMAYLEAQAAGLPVVAQRTGGIAAVVRDQVTGFLTAPNDVEAYAQALGRLIADRDLRQRLGDAAERFVRTERTVAGAAVVLDGALRGLVQPKSEPLRRPTAPADLSDPWRPALDELSRWRAAGRIARLWLRDDDAVADTPALRRLGGLAAAWQVPVLLAVIPARADPGLAGVLAAYPLLDAAVHGWSHANHAPAGEKAEEFPMDRGAAIIRRELGSARERLEALFGRRLSAIYVPPWNRISAGVAELLPGLGFSALSTFGARRLLGPGALLSEINTHVDIIDWRGTRGGREHAWLARDLATQLAAARREGRDHVGILAHHLVHDERAWGFLEGLMAELAANPAVRWCRAADLVDLSGTGAP